jgi:hypothetical protein
MTVTPKFITSKNSVPKYKYNGRPVKMRKIIPYLKNPRRYTSRNSNSIFLLLHTFMSSNWNQVTQHKHLLKKGYGHI